MSNFMDTFISFFSFSEYPAGDWHHGLGTAGLFGAIALFAMAVVVVVVFIEQTFNITKYNYETNGESILKSFGYALIGKFYEPILREQVTSIKKIEDGRYRVTAHDTENEKKYLVISVGEDITSPWYQEAKDLAGSNEQLFEDLKPRGKAICRMTMTDKITEKETNVILIYLKESIARSNDTREVEEILNRFFEQEFYDRKREARKEMREGSPYVYFDATI